MEYTYNGKKLEELNKTELLHAMGEVTARLFKNTKDPKYIRMAAFAEGAAISLEDGSDDDESIAFGLAMSEEMEKEFANDHKEI